MHSMVLMRKSIYNSVLYQRLALLLPLPLFPAPLPPRAAPRFAVLALGLDPT
jgi:hypothetical protein